MKRLIQTLVLGTLAAAASHAQPITQGPVTLYVVHLSPPRPIPDLPHTHGVVVFVKTDTVGTATFLLNLEYQLAGQQPVTTSRFEMRNPDGWTSFWFMLGDMKVLKATVSEVPKAIEFPIDDTEGGQ